MLHYKAVSPELLGLLKSLVAKTYLKEHFLVGGTALALQFGHRRSIDIDLFSNTEFDTAELKGNLEVDFALLQTIVTQQHFLAVVIENIKVDLVRFRYKNLFPFIEEENIRMLDARDIATMKLDTIASRGAQKDFFDLYRLCQEYSIHDMLNWHSNKSGITNQFHIIRCLTYFEDAEANVPPESLDGTTWKKVKEFFIKLVVSEF